MRARSFVLLIVLVLVFGAADAFACAHCRNYSDGCPTCAEDNYNGSIECELRDTAYGTTFCLERGYCEGPFGDCWKPAGCGYQYIRNDLPKLPEKDWRLASVTIIRNGKQKTIGS